MKKVFFYELRRLLWNPFFAGILAVIGGYGWEVLNRVTVLGVARTAPFSPWSFGDYLCRMLPVLWAGTLFFLTFYASETERGTAALIAASPVRPEIFRMVRCCAALFGAAILALAVLALAAVFYESLFRWDEWGTLLFPAAFTLVPPLVFAVGSGWLLGRIRPALAFAWMGITLLTAVLPLPEYLGMWDGSLFTVRPLALSVLDPPFSLPAGAAAAQLLLLLLGIALLVWQPGERAPFLKKDGDS